MATQLGYALPLQHQFDFSQAELFAFGQVFGRLVGQIRLAECALDRLVYHCALPDKLFSLGTDASRSGTRPSRRNFVSTYMSTLDMYGSAQARSQGGREVYHSGGRGPGPREYADGSRTIGTGGRHHSAHLRNATRSVSSCTLRRIPTLRL